MKIRSALLGTAVLTLAVGLSTAQAQTTRYWDITGATPGATNGDGIGDGTWDGVATNWNTDAAGGAGTITAWTNVLDHAVFAAGNDLGTDLSTAGAFVTVTGTQSAASVTFEDGAVDIGGGAMDSPLYTINSGARLRIDSILRFSTLAGKIVLDGGVYESENYGHAGSFIRNSQSLEIDGSGIIDYNDASFRLGISTDCNCTIYTPINSNAITGTGGTVDNGGAGTLIKDGPGEIRYQGLGLPLTTYAKLEVDEGLFRLGSNSSIADERGFGAVPLAVLPDAIKLDGGYIGLSFSTTLHANRGITVTSNGGGYAGPSQMTVPGPLSGTGTFHMVGGTVVLQNASNDTTFSGDLNLENGTLSVGGDSFLGAAPGAPDADHIKMGGVSPLAVATTGTLSFSASTTLNANRGIELTTGGTGRINIPTGGNTVTYGGNITGAGKFIKMGDGALVASGSLGHTGGTDIYGRLDVNGSLTSGPVAVKTTAAGLGANGTLAGTGTVGGAITVESGAHIAPGSGGIGELTSTAGVTLTAGSILDFDLGAPGTSDLLDVGTSTFTVDGGSVNLANAG